VSILEKTVKEKVVLKDYFNTLNSTKIQWTLAKYNNRVLNPLFAADVASVILPRSEHSVVRSVQHATFNEITGETLKKKKHISPSNLAVQLYAQATMDLHSYDFFEAAFIRLKESGNIPAPQDLGYLAQAAAILKRPEYTALLIKWFDDQLCAERLFTKKGAVWQFGKLFSFTQSLLAIA
jgi:hypothetical protein